MNTLPIDRHGFVKEINFGHEIILYYYNLPNRSHEYFKECFVNRHYWKFVDELFGEDIPNSASHAAKYVRIEKFMDKGYVVNRPYVMIEVEHYDEHDSGKMVLHDRRFNPDKKELENQYEIGVFDKVNRKWITESGNEITPTHIFPVPSSFHSPAKIVSYQEYHILRYIARMLSIKSEYEDQECWNKQIEEAYTKLKYIQSFSCPEDSIDNFSYSSLCNICDEIDEMSYHKPFEKIPSKSNEKISTKSP